MGDGGAWQALLGIVAYTTFISVFGFAVGASARTTGAAISLFMFVTFVVMSALPAVFPSSLREDAGRYTFLGLADSLTTCSRILIRECSSPPCSSPAMPLSH
ncbi:hypothetical protein [Parafrankia sp. EUN1f]|uniref:hypothetical protein n=1 Tax=Parafrankia sp. EUN1f TaxID=102897 RepID=UPI0002F7C216|nr:hypothetical protein [Parafrankia sp. EUN1f]